MGASGSAWIKPKKRAGLRTDDLTNTPHPRFARSGQRYFPLNSRALNAVTVRVLSVADDGCTVVREDAERGRRTVSLQRLLSATDDRVGRHYRFVGYASRTGYATHAFVLETERAWSRIVCPEWHPAIPITVASGALPKELCRSGAWVACRADLGACAAAHVAPSRFAAVAPGFDASVYHEVAVDAPGPERREPSGDVVLFVSTDELESAKAGRDGVYVTGHPPSVETGDRAYLHAGGAIRGWREVRMVRRLPNGVRVLLRGPWQPMTSDAEVRLPASGVAGGEHGRQLWTPATWASDAA